MKILTGKYKSKYLSSISNKNLRPTSGRLRQALFNILLHRFDWKKKLNNLNILEPFAGTGLMSIEAMSKLEDKATLIEKDKIVYKLLKENIKKLGLNDCINIINNDFFKLRKLNKYNFFYIDPPYFKNLAQLTLEKIFDESLISDEFIMICETEKDFKFKKIYENKISFLRIYGKSKISIINSD